MVSYRGKLLQNVQHRIVTSSCGACNHPELLVDVVGKTGTNFNFRKCSTGRLFTRPYVHSHPLCLYSTQQEDVMVLDLSCQDARLAFVSEDIGRHNTVDKTIGKAVLSGIADFNDTMLLLSGRCGWDIVAKAVRTGISAIASLGAFSSAAVDLARQHDITLYGFVREDGAWKVGHSAEMPPSIDESN